MKIKKIILSLLAVCAMFSCENDESVSTADASANLDVKDSPVVQKLINMGYKAEDIKETKDFYLAEGDIMFSKNINDYPKNETSRHASSNNLVATQYRIVTVYIDSSVSQSGVDNWSSAIESAMNKWTVLSGNSIAFVRIYEPADIIIKSDYGSLPSDVIAAAGFPLTSGKAYQEIKINLDFYNNQTISESTKTYNMVHEFGHCIGLRHTNWENEGLYDQYGNLIGANYIPNTPNQDPNSVMNSGTALYSWNGFSTYDVTAVNFLYPQLSCNVRLVGPAEGKCAYNAGGDIVNYNIYTIGIKQLNSDNNNPTWQLSGNSLQIVGTYGTYCKVGIKANNTTWPATGVLTRTSSSGCVTNYNISLNNCNDPSITD
jgi:hypothetical protein